MALLEGVADSPNNVEVEQLTLTKSAPSICDRFRRKNIPPSIQQLLRSVCKAVSGATAVARLLSDDRMLASVTKGCEGLSYDPLNPSVAEGLHYALNCLLEQVDCDLESLEIGGACAIEWEKMTSPH